MLWRYVLTRTKVRHRIDGLEIVLGVACQDMNVRHRIDGLEKAMSGANNHSSVRHRIDGLEISERSATR